MSSTKLPHNCKEKHWTYLRRAFASDPPHNAQLTTIENPSYYFAQGAYYYSYTGVKAHILFLDEIHDLCYSVEMSDNHFNCLCWRIMVV